ncbi:hypothetical protein EAY04_23880 [Vibrio anguillarum]|nr:hypothetical protein [Vibrio anguillarum]
MNPSIITFLILYPLVGFIIFYPAIYDYERATYNYLVITMQGLGVVVLILVGINALQDLRDLLKKIYP